MPFPCGVSVDFGVRVFVTPKTTLATETKLTINLTKSQIEIVKEIIQKFLTLLDWMRSLPCGHKVEVASYLTKEQINLLEKFDKQHYFVL